MTRQRAALYVLLATVATAAAVLSFSALRDLALVCGFSERLAWLLPVTVDAGAAAGSIVWLGRWSAPAAAGYARVLALVLLGGSVGGNALGHGLAAYNAQPHWLVVVGVSAIAPTVLGALVHLVVLVGRPVEPETDRDEALSLEEEAAQLFALRNDTDHDSPRTADPTDPDRRTGRERSDGDIITEAREWAVELRRPPSRDEMLERFRIGAGRCRRLRLTLGWADASTEPTAVADR